MKKPIASEQLQLQTTTNQTTMINKYSKKPIDKGFDFSEPRITKSAPAFMVDRKSMITRFLSGQPVQGFSKQPMFAQVPDITSYSDALELIQHANDSFYELSSEVRAHFKNDPIQFADSFRDPKQHESLYQFGLLKRPASDKKQEPAAAEPTPTGTSGAPAASSKGGTGGAS